MNEIIVSFVDGSPVIKRMTYEHNIKIKKMNGYYGEQDQLHIYQKVYGGRASLGDWFDIHELAAIVSEKGVLTFENSKIVIVVE